MSYSINKDCIGCGACAKKCPEQAISGEVKKRFDIDSDLCTECGTCFATCTRGAVCDPDGNHSLKKSKSQKPVRAHIESGKKQNNPHRQKLIALSLNFLAFSDISLRLANSCSARRATCSARRCRSASISAWRCSCNCCNALSPFCKASPAEAHSISASK